MVVAFAFLVDPAFADLGALDTIARALAEPATLRLEEVAGAALPPALDVPWPRAVKVYAKARVPFLVREGDTWTFRGVQDAAGTDGAVWLRVFQLPGAGVAVVPWSAAVPVRPGPGALHSIAWRLGGEGEVEVDVLQVSPLCDGPSVELGMPFDAVELDGEEWCAWHGARISLPARTGTYRLWARRLDRETTPRLAATRAVVTRCRYDDEARVLEIAAQKRPEDDERTVYTAWLTGPEPREVLGDDAARVPESTFTHRDDAAAAAALGAGVVIRFRPGLVRVRYP
jgi:hypothetical protein